MHVLRIGLLAKDVVVVGVAESESVVVQIHLRHAWAALDEDHLAHR